MAVLHTRFRSLTRILSFFCYLVGLAATYLDQGLLNLSVSKVLIKVPAAHELLENMFVLSSTVFKAGYFPCLKVSVKFKESDEGPLLFLCKHNKAAPVSISVLKN